MDHLTPLQKLELAQAVRTQLTKLEYDTTLRAKYMNDRDRAIYGTGLFEGLDFPDGHDRTDYNLVKRVVDIQTSQLMGREFQVYSNYDKEDLSLIEADDQMPQEQKDQELKLAELRNKKKASNADMRKLLLDGVYRDNRGSSFWKHAAKVGSAYGETIIKQWADFDEKKIKRSVIETPSNVRFGWSDNEFREWDWVAYVYQMSKQIAYRKYSKFVPEGMTFQSTIPGVPMSTVNNGMTSDPLDQTQKDGIPVQTQRDMVTCIDFTGYLPGYAVTNGVLSECKDGEETILSLLMVGGWAVQLISDEKYLPTYYRVPNRELPQRSYGEADITDSLISLNRTYIERMSDWITVANKTLFPMLMGKGFETGNVPIKKARQMKVVPMDNDQSIEPVQMPNNFGFDYQQIISKIEDNFVRIAGIGRVLWDDPSINPTSNQALMTTFKGVIDIVEDKQSRWDPAIMEMDMQALKLIAKMLPETKDAIEEDGWFLYVKWPSVLRREDQSYQQMYLNRFQFNTISLRSYLEAMGVDNVSEEIDRIRDELKDPVTAAVLAREVGQIASRTIFQSFPTPPPVDVKVNLKGELTPNQEANLASMRGFNDGPYPASAGPQGNQGDAANQNLVNEGFINGNPFDGGTPIQAGPPKSNPTPLASENQPGAGMVPAAGSGAPSASPQGAINHTLQNAGK